MSCERAAERVPDVQRPGDVGRRQDDAVRRPVAGQLRMEVAALDPRCVPARLDLAGVVLRRHLGARLRHLLHGTESTGRPLRPGRGSRRWRRPGGRRPRWSCTVCVMSRATSRGGRFRAPSRSCARASSPYIAPPSGCASMMPSLNRVSRSPPWSGSRCTRRSVSNGMPNGTSASSGSCTAPAPARWMNGCSWPAFTTTESPGERRSTRRIAPVVYPSVSKPGAGSRGSGRPAPPAGGRPGARCGTWTRRGPRASTRAVLPHRVEDAEGQVVVSARVVEGVAADLVRGLERAGDGDLTGFERGEGQQAPLDLRRERHLATAAREMELVGPQVAGRRQGSRAARPSSPRRLRPRRLGARRGSPPARPAARAGP